MKVFVVHQIYRRDSDTGHDTLWFSKIHRVFKTKKEADGFIASRSWWYIPSITEMEVEE